MRGHVIKAVFQRNFLSYFSGVIGYLFITAFVGVGAALAFRAEFFSNNLANLDQLNQYFPWLLMAIVPAITMGVWADERKQGTDELLFTLPASDLEILIGKYLAVVGVYTVALVFSLSHWIVLRYLGSPDYGLLLATYLGYWVAGCTLLSCGMVASVLTSSPTVAYTLGILICAIPVGISYLTPWTPWLAAVGVQDNLRDFGMGMVPLSGLFFFSTFTLVMLYLNLVLISRRHWAGGPKAAPMGLHYLVRIGALLVSLIALNVVAANWLHRFDLTQERLYSLSPVTRKLVAEIKPDRPIQIQAFISPEVTKEYAPVRSTLVGLLRQLDQIGGDRIRLRIVDTEKFSKAAEEAKRLYNIDGREVQAERGGRIYSEDIYLGVVITGGADEEVILPFFDVGMPIEYELARSVRTVSQTVRKKLGIVRSDAKLTGGFDMQSFRSSPEWKIVTELKRQYDVKEVAPEELSKSEFDVVLAAMPSSFTEGEMQQFVAYIETGKPVLILDDPFPLSNVSLAPKQPKPRQGGMMGGGPPPEMKADNGEAKSLTNLLEIGWDSGETVWDAYDPHPEISEQLRRLDIVYVADKSGGSRPFSPTSPITSGLQEVMLVYPGQIRPREDSKLEFTPLLRSSPAAVTYAWDEYTESAGFFGGVSPKAVMDPKVRTKIEYVLAAKITGEKRLRRKAAEGKDSDAEPQSTKINVIYIADLDLISDTFYYIRDSAWKNMRLDNIAFLLNCVDDLAGESTFMDLRKRRPKHRVLERVESQSKKFKDEMLEKSATAKKDADAELKLAEQKLRDEVEKIRKDTTMDEQTKMIRERTAEMNLSRQLEVTRQEIDNTRQSKTRAALAETQREIRSIENWTYFWSVLLSPIPALLVGIYVYARRVSMERQGINPERLIGRRAAT